MKILGLTGGIGSGKSTVSRFLTELGAVILDADKVGHDALEDTGIRQKIVSAFGQQVLAPNGNIDRKKLGELVFGDAKSLAKLNQIMHPMMYQIVKVQLKEYRQQEVNVVVLEAPLLIEAGWTPLVDEVWVTAASEDTVIKRLQERAGLSEAESSARIRSQLSSTERARFADVVIDTDCSLDELKMKVEKLWQKF